MKSFSGLLSVVIPVYNEAGNIRTLYEELSAVLNDFKGELELIWVNDGSKDDSLTEIKTLVNADSRVKCVSLSRNFGHQLALVAGLEHSSGDVVITMDGDGQHPASVIPQLIEKFQEGHDIVNTIRANEEAIGGLKKGTSKVFYRWINRLSDVPIQSASADFRLMNRKAVNAFLEIKEKDRFNRGLIGWMGFKQCFVSFDAPKRQVGKSKYTWNKMFRFASDGIFSFSSRPLKISFFLGVLTSLLGLIYAVYAVIQYFRGNTIAGWTSLMIVVLVLGGIQLLSIGIIGEYISRVFNEAKRRPLYFVDELITNDRLED